MSKRYSIYTHWKWINALVKSLPFYLSNICKYYKIAHIWINSDSSTPVCPWLSIRCKCWLCVSIEFFCARVNRVHAYDYCLSYVISNNFVVMCSCRFCNSTNSNDLFRSVRCFRFAFAVVPSTVYIFDLYIDLNWFSYKLLLIFLVFFRGTIWVLTRFAMRKTCRRRSHFSARDEHRKFTFRNARALKELVKERENISTNGWPLVCNCAQFNKYLWKSKKYVFFRWIKIVPEKKKWNQFSGHLYDAYIIRNHIHRPAKQFIWEMCGSSVRVYVCVCSMEHDCYVSTYTTLIDHVSTAKWPAFRFGLFGHNRCGGLSHDGAQKVSTIFLTSSFDLHYACVCFIVSHETFKIIVNQ